MLQREEWQYASYEVEPGGDVGWSRSVPTPPLCWRAGGRVTPGRPRLFLAAYLPAAGFKTRHPSANPRFKAPNAPACSSSHTATATLLTPWRKRQRGQRRTPGPPRPCLRSGGRLLFHPTPHGVSQPGLWFLTRAPAPQCLHPARDLFLRWQRPARSRRGPAAAAGLRGQMKPPRSHLRGKYRCAHGLERVKELKEKISLRHKRLCPATYPSSTSRGAEPSLCREQTKQRDAIGFPQLRKRGMQEEIKFSRATSSFLGTGRGNRFDWKSQPKGRKYLCLSHSN